MLKKGTILVGSCLVIVIAVAGLLDKMLSIPNDKKSASQSDTSIHQPLTKPIENSYSTNANHVEVVPNPQTIPVLINKQNRLPEQYEPNDLVIPKIPFMNNSREKRKMRKEAAKAIEKLFNGAKQQGIELLGVSAYRSYKSQSTLFQYYANRDGVDAAKTYSALPGTSEHETGLAIDVTGGDGSCAAEDCFAGTKEAKWLQHHASDYGFIIRYPKGKDSITGYKYEPWHLRYIGKPLAKTIMSRGITLEEYYKAVPVNGGA